jgi:manganese/zinc/iron transport system ATP- binding protein
MNVQRLVLGGRYVHLGWFGRPGREDERLAQNVMERLGIAHLAQQQIGQLSGGQQQRALLARALVQDADLLLLDEPLNAVDVETREVVVRTLRELKQQHKTALIATHDLGRLETDFDGALYLCEGREIESPPGAFVGLRVGCK